MIGLRPGIDLQDHRASAPPRQAWLGKMGAALDDKTAYQRIQATRPQTLGVALTDSPVGLAAWIVEKFRDWSDCSGDPLNSFSMDTAARQHHGLLADRHRGHRDLALSRRHRSRSRAPCRPARASRRRRRSPPSPPISRRRRPRNGSSAPTTCAATRSCRGRPLRRPRGARPAGRGHPRLLPTAALRRGQRLGRVPRRARSQNDVACSGQPTIAANLSEKKQSGNVRQFSIDEVPFTA